MPRPASDNYCRHRVTHEVLFFATEEGMPAATRDNPHEWDVYDLPDVLWTAPYHRIGEDLDARIARMMRHPRYTHVPPLCSVPWWVSEPHRADPRARPLPARGRATHGNAAR